MDAGRQARLAHGGRGWSKLLQVILYMANYLSLALVWSFSYCSSLCSYMYALTQAHPTKSYIYLIPNVSPPFQMSMPTLREHIYTSRSVVAEAQHNVMHALFVVLCSKTTHTRKDLQKGLRIFNHLLEKHFNSNLEVRRASVGSHTPYTICVACI